MHPARFRAIALVLAALAVVSAIASSPARAAPPSGRVALLIANAAYPDSDVTLPTPAADARALAEELKRRGFSVELAENLGKEAMQTTIAGFAKRIESRSIALVFFAGYGIQAGRQNYMIPVDARIWSEADVLRDGLAVDGLLEELARRGADTRVLVLDASRRNPFERRFRSFSTGLAAARAAPGTLALHSAAAGSVLNETSATRSLFVTELVKQIALPGQSAEQAFGAARDALARATRNQQVPALASGLQEAFSFDPDWSAGIAAGKQPSAGGGWVEPVRPAARPDPKKAEGKPPAGAAPTDPADSPTLPAAKESEAAAKAEEQALREFEAAGRLGTREAYEAFLRAHPAGPLAARARTEIERIRTAEAAEAARREAARQEAAKEAAKEEAARQEAARQEAARQEAARQEAARQEAARKEAPPPAFTEAERRRKAALDERIGRNPRDEAAYYERGQFFAQRGEAAPAVADFDRVLQLNPVNPAALNNRCWTRAILNDLQRALADCNAALKLRPDFVDALDSRGLINLKTGAFRAAMADYDAALKLDANHSSALYGRGLARRGLGDTAQADRDFAEALQLNPTLDKEFAQYGFR